MSSSNFPADPPFLIVADSSVVINLNATGRANDIIRTLNASFVVTENSLNELERAEAHGYDDAAKLKALVAVGLVAIQPLGANAELVYASLIEGSALRTLDDGEAATIGYASEHNGVAVIDERKGRSICAESFQTLRVASTVDILTHPNVEAALGVESRNDALYKALKEGRMRVPHDQLEKVVGLIGVERAANCSSLPRTARTIP